MKIKLKQWAQEDLENFNVKRCQEYVNEDLLKDWTTAQLQNMKISYPVSEFVVSHWIREAGFSYCAHKKSYYVDRHEDLSIVKYRIKYVAETFDQELYEHCWIQMTLSEYKYRKRNGSINDFTAMEDRRIHKYIHPDTPLGEYGGNLSVRFPAGAKPIQTFGQDEAVFRSSQLNEMCWTIDDVSPLRKKGMGAGVMVSAFTDRGYGFGGPSLSQEQLAF
mmetsp:Transcript_4463/g.6923  ORF Transcript_4463/g.6923 Transcript_4463/m.6923 type:complete len:219 (+) Transcript_4463:221-877(+)